MLRASLIGLFVHVSGILCAQEFPSIHFVVLTDKDGLSNNKTTSVAQDTNGVIWIGTINGLNRFDGYHFAKFYSNPHDAHSLPGSKIVKIFPDSAGHFWLMTGEGLCCFNTTTLTSQTFRSDTPASFHTYVGDNIFFEDKTHPYVITPYGILYFSDSVHYRFMSERFPSFVFEKNLYHGYTNIVRDDQGQTWAFLGNHIFKIDRTSKQVLETHIAPWDINIADLHFDHRNRAWLSTWNAGIYIYNRDKDTWAPYPITDFRVQGTVVGRCVEWAWNGGKYLVFPTNSPGLLLVDEATDHSNFYRLPVSMGFIGSIFVDRQNIMWVPTDNGMVYAPPSSNLFDLIKVSPELHGGTKSGEPDQSCVYDMKELPSGFWISKRYDGGIYWFSKDWKFKGFWPKTVEGPDSIFPNGVGTHREGYDFEQVGDQIYITTEWGMMVMDLKSHRKKLYTIPGISANPRLRTIAPENEHTWWVRSLAQGIFQFDPTTCRFKRRYILDPGCPACIPPAANYMILDKLGRVFVTSNAGLYQYDRNRDTFFKVQPKGNLILGNFSQGLAEDSSGRLWIGSDNGLCVFNPETREVERTFPENRKIGQIIRIVTDPYQNIWFNSVSGYWCWLRKQDKMVQFGYDMGLPDNDEGAFYTTSDGLVYGGGTDALIRFYPERLMAYSNHPATRIVELRVNDSLVLPAIAHSGEKRIDLRPRENNLSLYFDVLNYDLRDNNLYYYRLEPGNDAWKQNEDGHLSFNNLEPGTYRLSVTGSNKLTGIFTPSDSLLFTIEPFWYQTWWWKTVCFLVLTGLVAFFVWRRIDTIRKESAFRQKITETEMQALRAQMNPHFIFNSLNSIENFIMRNERRLASDYLNKFARLIRMILNSSRNELVPFAKDMEAIQLYVDLEQLRFQCKFTYTTGIDPVLMDGDYRVLSLLIQPYVENAIVHGIAHSERKDLQLKVSAYLDKEYIHYVIEDNGVGRQQAEEYNRVNKPHHKSVGLQISEDRMHIFNQQKEAHGEIRVTDLHDVEGRASGTRIDISIKAI